MLDKSTFRSYAKNKLKTNSQAKCASYKSLKALKQIIKAKKAKNILLYIPLNYEVDVLRLRRTLSKDTNIFVPFMLDESLKIVKLRLPFLKGKFNISQAMDSMAHTPRIDLAVVPAIGVDANMARIGHGMGFYDRFFSSLNYIPCIIFISALDLFVKLRLCAPHDIRGDFYVTPRRSYKGIINDRNHSWGLLASSGRRCRLYGSPQDKRCKLQHLRRTS